MFDGKVYADFALLWRLCHQSRVEAEKPDDCWLEQWSSGPAAGACGPSTSSATASSRRSRPWAAGSCRTRPTMRSAKSSAPASSTAQDYYRQLLRLVYRLLFLFVAEDRELLFDPQADAAEPGALRRFYSTARLRRLAERLRGTQHADLFRHSTWSWKNSESDAGCPELGLPVLGSFLFSPQRSPTWTAASSPTPTCSTPSAPWH